MTIQVSSSLRFLAVLAAAGLGSPLVALPEYDATFFKNDMVIKEKVEDEWVDVFKASCRELKRHKDGASYACKDATGYEGNRATLNFKTGKGVILALLPTKKAKTSRSAFQCDITENRKGLSGCVLSGGRRVPGRPNLVSPFRSQVKGLDLPNAHWLVEPLAGAQRSGVMRGMNPQIPADYEQLKKANVKRVLIFKEFSDSAAGTLEAEMQSLASIGIERELVTKIDFPYHGFKSYQRGCEMIIQGLNVIKAAQIAKETILFHCTVGEDRTGVLSGLFKLFQHKALDVADVFETQMCEYGYERGNPFKPANVNANIKNDLTRLFMFVASKIKALRPRATLDAAAICSDANETVPALDAPSCETSTRLYVHPL